MRYIKYAPRLTPINEDLTASMVLLKRREAQALHRKRRVVEIVRVGNTSRVSQVALPSPSPCSQTKTDSPATESEPVTLEPLRNRTDSALTAPPPVLPPPVPAPSVASPPVLPPTSTDAKAENKYGRSALHVAVRKGDVAAVKHLIAAQPELLQRPDIRGNLPLHYAANAATKNASEIVFCLLKAGAVVNAVNERGQSPLLIHVISNESDDDMVARLLLHNNAQPRIQVTETMLLSEYAASRGLRHIAAALTEYM